MTDLLDAALALARCGISVFPLHYPVDRGGQLLCSCGNRTCKDAGKHPYARLAPQGLKNATTDRRTVEGWWRPGTPYNVAARTGAVSGLVVVDIDPRHDGDKSLVKLEERHGPLPPTWRSITGSGGEHIFFQHPGYSVRNAVGTIAPGIDLRGEGGYIVTPPSRHICGRNYAWNVDFHPDGAPLASMPPWLLRTPDPKRGKRVDFSPAIDQPIAEGRRNAALTSIFGHLLSRHVDPHLAAALVRAFNRVRCEPPLDDTEIRGIIGSIAERERQRRERTRYGH